MGPGEATGELAQLLVVAASAFGASVLGGISGFGVGLMVAPLLLPLVGVKGVVPVITIAMVLGNLSRAWVYRREIEPAFLGRLLLPTLPGVVIGTAIYNALPPRALAIVIGGFLIVSVALRRRLGSRRIELSGGGVMAVGFGFGVLSGSSPGAGILLVSILLGIGLEGGALVGTDAVIGVAVNLLKTALFGTYELLDTRLAFAGLVIGAAMIPGAYAARFLVQRMGTRLHVVVIELFVVAGGAIFLLHAFRD